MTEQITIEQPTVRVAEMPEAPPTTAPVLSEPLVVPETHMVVKEVGTRRVELPESRMRRSFRIPIVATLVWIITMIAIFYLGRQVAGYYTPVVQGDRVEFVGRS